MGLRLEAAARGRIKTISAPNPPQPHASPQALRVLKLEPIRRAAIPVARVWPLRDDPLQPHLASKRGEDNLALGVLQVLIERHAI